MSSTYKTRSFCYYLFLKRKWERMKEFYSDNYLNICLPHTVFKDTAVHVAVYSDNEELVKSLLDMVYREYADYFLGGPAIFQKQNTFGNTPLHEAASIGNVDMVKIIMHYDPKQLNTKNKRGETPFFTAAVYGNTNVIRHLAPEIKKDADDHERPYFNHTSSRGSTMLHEAIRGYYFETALELVKPEYHIWTDQKDSDDITCFQLLANIPSAFESGYSFGILEKLIYLCLPVVDYSKNKDETNSVSQVPPTPNTDLERAGDHSKDKDGNKNVSHFPPSPNTAFQKITAKMYVTFWSIIAKGFPSIKDLWDTKKKHGIVVELSKILAGGDKSWQVNNTDGQNDTPLLAAARNGIIEIIEAIFNLFPQAIEHENHKRENIFHVVVEHRRRQLLEYLLQTCHVSYPRLLWKINQDGDGILHKAAYKSHYSSRERPGEALRLQSDIHWFERVKKLVPPHHINHLNHHDNLTPHALFTKEHKELVKNGQEWLIRTTNSCIIVAVLIATVAFTSIYTVPGGSDPKTGKPLLLTKTPFTVFTASDVASLCFAFTSVVVFLSISTSKMNERDFRRALPLKLVLGLSMLFWSVAALMVGFAATLDITINQRLHEATAPIITIACFPVAFFLLLQLPLYFNITWFTIKDLLQTLVDCIPQQKCKSSSCIMRYQVSFGHSLC
ncbi:protein ACCELERATED CELL DEATH 6-like isoform X1 [Rosa rugosa]|uniref:protein ACCELERATED CELL DEATH 6-like isoform X1 n=1 Tax=Rosa rugosa TaxID=74645 RepID=UPI002B4054DF|nr:protein ACCELERATED CELL DEATH 6-like isoform X1 [Rosa rugosa]